MTTAQPNCRTRAFLTMRINRIRREFWQRYQRDMEALMEQRMDRIRRNANGIAASRGMKIPYPELMPKEES